MKYETSGAHPSSVKYHMIEMKDHLDQAMDHYNKLREELEV